MKPNTRHYIGWRWLPAAPGHPQGVGETLRLGLATANTVLSQAYRLYSRAGVQATVSEAWILKLASGKVIGLPHKDGLRRLRVLSGSVWLTGTPDRRDVILQTGNHFRLTGQGPFVIEALADLEMMLEP